MISRASEAIEWRKTWSVSDFCAPVPPYVGPDITTLGIQEDKLDSHLRFEKDHAFILPETEVKKIWASLEEAFGEVSADVEFTDNIERKANTLEQLLSFENSKNRSVKRIEFNSKDESHDNRITISFEDYTQKPIRVRASGDDDLITRFGDSLQETIDGLKPWYYLICKINFFFIIGVVIFIGMMLLNIMVPDKPRDNPVELSKAIEILSIIFGSIGVLWLSVWGLNKIKSYCFPIATFSIGQGKERHRIRENIRWGVVVAFIVSFSASAVFGLLG